jgi:hypothetical protein
MRPSAKPELVPKGLKLVQLVANRHRVSSYLSSTAPCAPRPAHRVPCAVATPEGCIAATSAPS